jgi:hypothetical protein
LKGDKRWLDGRLRDEDGVPRKSVKVEKQRQEIAKRFKVWAGEFLGL